jgi:hypothetical protein
MKLSGYGCSFIYGTDLSSTESTWPAIIARRLGYDYACHANPGSGNLQIMESVLKHGLDDDFSVMSWTWIDRFDLINSDTESWETLRPVLDHEHAEYYFKNIHSQYRDMLTNLTYINTAMDFLISNNKKFLMTFMDHLILEKIHPNWHDPLPIHYLQQKIIPYLKTFDGYTFLEWSRNHGFPVSDSWHPLEDAHQAAAEYFGPTVKSLIDKYQDNRNP